MLVLMTRLPDRGLHRALLPEPESFCYRQFGFMGFRIAGGM